MLGPYLAEILLLVALPLLLTASAFFSGSETALFSLSRHDRLVLSKSNTVAAHKTATLLAETRSLLITLLLGNMTINVVYFVLSTVLLIRLRHTHEVNPITVAALSPAPLLMVILLGEVLPKLIAARAAAGWSRATALPLWIIHRTLGPLRWALNLFVITPLARLISPSRQPEALSAQELQTLLDLSQAHGVIDHDEEQLLEQVLELSQIKVRELMTPRVDIQAHDIQSDVKSLFDLIRATRLTHIPVYRGDLDDIVGVLDARVVMTHQPKNPQMLVPLAPDAVFVPEQQRADQLLAQLRRTGATFAIVVDEYGGTSGLITLENVVEHLVGGIAGPYESTHGPKVVAIAEQQWRADSALPIRDWPELFDPGDAMLGRMLESISTLGGLVMARLGRLPRVGDAITLGNVVIEVESMQGPRVATLLVRLADGSPNDPHTGVNTP